MSFCSFRVDTGVCANRPTACRICIQDQCVLAGCAILMTCNVLLLLLITLGRSHHCLQLDRQHCGRPPSTLFWPHDQAHCAAGAAGYPGAWLSLLTAGLIMSWSRSVWWVVGSLVDCRCGAELLLSGLLTVELNWLDGNMNPCIG